MKFRTALLVVVGLVASGCGPSRQQRIHDLEFREFQCIQRYNSGNIQTAKQALLDHLRLLEEEEASGLPFRRIAWSRAITTTRLALIYRRLGDTGLADQDLRQAVAYARKDAQEEGIMSWKEKTDDQVMTLLTNAVNRLDENTHPKWKLE